MKRVCSAFAFLLIITSIYGQYDPKENFYDAEFFFAEEDYSEALYAFTQVYKEGFQNNSNINYRIGVCLLNIDNRKTESIPYLEKAVEKINVKYKEGIFKEESAPPDAFLYLGNAYRIDNQFDKAIENYNKFLGYQSTETGQSLYAKLQIDACNAAKNTLDKREDFEVGTLGQINMISAPVYNPAISGDLNTFAFMGREKFYNGIYISRKQDGKWLKPYNITPSVQSDGNQTVLSLSNDGNILLLAWADNFDSDIWVSEYKNNRWNVSTPIGKPINSKYYESHACFSPDGNTIFFTSNRKESMGDMDIFKCVRNEDGTWSNVILLGDNINTALNEENPFVSPDGKRLYFSSQGHAGLGGFDIFYCDILEDGSFSKPVNLGYPLNSTDDDFAFSPREVEFESFLTLYAKGGEEQVDIFRFEWIPASAQPVQLAFETMLVSDKLEEKPIAAETVTKDEDEIVSAEEVAENVIAAAEEVTGKVLEEVAEVVETAVEEIVDETYMVRPVYFDFDSYALTASSQSKLDQLADIMNRFPNIEVEIVGHTDAVGSEEYNLRLSLNRAKAVAGYLESKGIKENRLNFRGKGETDPVALNRTADNRDAPKGRALNRRVHFSITVPNGIMIEVEPVAVPDNLKIK